MFTEEENIDSQFRVWITCDATAILPTHVLQTSIKLLIDTPRVHQYTCNKLNIHVLQTSAKLIIDTWVNRYTCNSNTRELCIYIFFLFLYTFFFSSHPTIYIFFQTMRDLLVRSFQWIMWQEPDIVKKISRPEWPVLLHNMCYLHAAIKLRARVGRGGWNNPSELANTSISDLIVCNFMLKCLT